MFEYRFVAMNKRFVCKMSLFFGLPDRREVIEHELNQTNDLWLLSIKQLNKSRLQLLNLLYSTYALQITIHAFGFGSTGAFSHFPFSIFPNRKQKPEGIKTQFLCARKPNSSHAHCKVFRNMKAKWIVHTRARKHLQRWKTMRKVTTASHQIKQNSPNGFIYYTIYALKQLKMKFFQCFVIWNRYILIRIRLLPLTQR